MQKEELNDVNSEEPREKIIEKKTEEEKELDPFTLKIEKLKAIEGGVVVSDFLKIQTKELTDKDREIWSLYEELRKSGFPDERIEEFDKKLLELQREEKDSTSSQSLLNKIRTDFSFQSSRPFKKQMAEEEKKEKEGKPGEVDLTEYEQEQIGEFRQQFGRVKEIDPNKKLRKINVEHLGEEEHKIWKYFKKFTHEGWPKIRISEFKELLSKHEPIIRKLSTKKGEADKAESIKNFIEYLGEEVEKENEQE